MRVLVATDEGQGTRAGDFCWTVEGEIVLAGPVLECCDPHGCGCGRGFPSLGSARSTTTAMVVERAGIEAADLRRAIRDSLERRAGSPSSTATSAMPSWPKRPPSSRGRRPSSRSAPCCPAAATTSGNASTSPPDRSARRQSGDAPLTSPNPSDL